jgi:cytochrome c
MRKFALRAATLALVLGANAALAETPNLGRPISEADIAAWDISILPDGQGLPTGSGTAAQGKTVYAVESAARWWATRRSTASRR